MKKIISAILTGAVMCTTCASAASFNDINGHWAETIINKLADEGIVSGFGDNSFVPNGAVTRAEYLKMIMNATGIEETECGAEGYLDVKQSEWYSGYLKSAMDKGLIPQEMITGYKSEIVSENDETGRPVSSFVKYSGSFNGGLAITREEMAFLTMSMYQYILNARTMEGLADKQEISFTDEDNISQWAVTGVNLAAANGLIEGMDDGSFQPKATTTRAQSATVIGRILNKIKK